MKKRKNYVVSSNPFKTMIQLNKISFIGFLCLLSILMISCDEETVSSNSDIKNVALDSTKTSFVNIAGKLFSIPSPIQTAILIKNSGIPYNREALNNPANTSNYVSKNSRALNLGIFGTDMAYSSLYDDSQQAIRYFKAVENLAEALEVKGALSPSLIKRLGTNVGNADSLLFLSGKFYEAADQYLKENERYDLAALILAGGWIEATHLTALAANTGNSEARQRLAEQKKAIGTLCDVLRSASDDAFKSGTTMVQLDSLNGIYRKVENDYTYKKPETDPERKITVITSQSSFDLTDEQLAEISKRIERIRASITQ